MKNFFQKAIVLPLIVVIVLIIVIYKVKTVPVIEHQELQFPVKTVQVIRLKKLPFRNRAMAYGHVEPAVLLNAKTEVSGKISYLHPLLKKGASLPAGTLVVRIEPTTFEFSRDQSLAGLSSSENSLKQLEVEEKSTRRSLDIARKNLSIGEQELSRLLRILKKGLVARSTIDEEQQKVLQLRQQVEDLQGKLDSYISRKSSTEAQIKQSKTQLAQSQDTLGRTEIRLPFDARIGTVSVEKGEYVSTGTILFEALGTQAVEINAQLPISQFYPLISGFADHSLRLNKIEDLQQEFLKINLQSIVKLVGYDSPRAVWQGELLRIGEAIDPDRDTIGLVVAVNKPYELVIPGERPPLLKGMFASVEIFTPVRELFVIPRKAIHQGRIYLANDKNQLEIRPVSILFKQGNLVVIDIHAKGTAASTLKEGEKIIISDVIPLIDGLPLKPVLAETYEQQLAIDALSEQAVNPVEMHAGNIK